MTVQTAPRVVPAKHKQTTINRFFTKLFKTNSIDTVTCEHGTVCQSTCETL